MSPAPEESRNQRQTVVGTVVSDKMQKTVVVEIDRLTRHRLSLESGRVSINRTLSPSRQVFASSWAFTRVLRRTILS